MAASISSVAGPSSATPGQQALGLVVRRDDDLGPPTLAQAFVFTLVFYVTLAATGMMLDSWAGTTMQIVTVDAWR